METSFNQILKNSGYKFYELRAKGDTTGTTLMVAIKPPLTEQQAMRLVAAAEHRLNEKIKAATLQQTTTPTATQTTGVAVIKG